MKLGLALGAGGAKGLAHIGALEVFADAGIHFDVVSGTSVGAIVGAIYASGTLKEFQEEVLAIHAARVPLLLSPTVSLSGFFTGERALEKLQNFLPYSEIQDLPIPYTALSVDLNSAELVRFTQGPILEAVRSSFSIPGIFTPIQTNNQCLVDGALIEPLPIEDARSLGADIVVAIDLFSRETAAPQPQNEKPPLKFPTIIAKGISHLYDSLLNKTEVTHLIQVLEASLTISQRTLTELRLKDSPADLLIQPAIAGINTFEFYRAKEGIEIGRRAAQEALPKLQQLLA